jgi:glycerol-3-phosphate acyltransferase PlsY
MGSLPTAYLIGRWVKGIDIRTVGTHNMGAMNTFYQIGFWWGALALALDIGKGAGAVILAKTFETGIGVEMLAGLVAILGHSYPVWLHFKGGKGGASAIGVLSVFMPWGFLIFIGVFGILLLVTRFPTLSYSIAFSGFFIAGWLIYAEWGFVAYTAGILAVPLIQYIPRLKEIGNKSSNLKDALFRNNLKDRR